MINHPSTVCLPEKDSGNPVDLLHLMKEITDVLLDKDLTDDCVATAFGLTSATYALASDSSYSIANSLIEYNKMFESILQWETAKWPQRPVR